MLVWGLGLGTITQVMAHLTASWRVTHHITMRMRRLCSCTGHPAFGLPLSRVLLPQLEAGFPTCENSKPHQVPAVDSVAEAAGKQVFVYGATASELRSPYVGAQIDFAQHQRSRLTRDLAPVRGPVLVPRRRGGRGSDAHDETLQQTAKQALSKHSLRMLRLSHSEVLEP